jgi:cellobiose-specific phosphotransferase system component IIC
MNKKHMIGWAAFVAALGLSVAVPIGYALAKYSDIVTTQAGAITAMSIIALVFAARYILYRLKMTAQDGYGMSKEMARELRYFFPLLIFLAIVMAIETNVAGISDVVRVTLIMNLLAAPLRLVSYRLSKRYDNDTGTQKLTRFLL